MKAHMCPKCGKTLANRHNLSRHKKNCQVHESVRSDNLNRCVKTHNGCNRMEKEIPTFDGSEFDGTKPKSRETMEKLRRLVEQHDGTEQNRSRENDLGDSTKKQKKSEGKEEKQESLSELLQIDPNLLKDVEEHSGEDSEEEDSDKDSEEKDPNKDSAEVSEEDSGEDEEKKDSENSAEEEEDSDKNELEDLIQSTLEYLIKPEQDELWDLVAEFGDEIEDHEVMKRLKELVDAFLVGELYEGELIIPKIHDIIRQLESSDMPRTKVLRLKMLIDDIDRNRYRVKSILTRLNNVRDEEQQHFTDILKMLIQEELISLQEYDEFLKAAGNLPEIAEIIRDTKIGEGMSFFPSRMNHQLRL